MQKLDALFEKKGTPENKLTSLSSFIAQFISDLPTHTSLYHTKLLLVSGQ